ncbi:MAG: Crp/Fnr family transcriptional regulator [Kiritimatiellae bacterium]|nr:Crp/Fnr family transcriptional regulator [Kiritimatiellia bacterium]
MSELIQTFLRQCPYFKGLSPANIAALAGVCRVARVRKRDPLFHEGTKGNALFLLLAGSVQLLKTSEDGQEVVIKTVTPGEVFAEVVLFEQDAYPVTALATDRAEVCRIPRREFRRLLNREDFRDNFVAGLMQRMRYLANRILYLTAYDAEERFFRFLAEQYGEKELYRLNLAKKDIAAAIGTSPETLSRLKERLTAGKKIQWDGRIIRLPPGFWSRRR